jgi:metallo-beta-lactamase family protein
MKITFFGAAREVTGSCSLVEAPGGPFLVDCGLFQGDQDSDARNRQFPFSPASIQAVFLTHAHLDHCGRLPLLYAQGFRGPIYATAATRDLTQFILLDAAKLQLEDYVHQQRKQQRAGELAEPPLYREADVLYTMSLFRSLHYEEPLALPGGCQALLHQSGHILGSAFVELRGDGKTVLFSGDMGTPGRNVVPDPADPPPADLVVCESTYGDRQHKTQRESVMELADALRWAYQAGGNVVVPSFALERSQDLLYDLRQLREGGQVPKNPVYLDSPLSINITEVYRRHMDDLDNETRAVVGEGRDPFSFPGLYSTPQTEQSKAINEKNGVVIIAGSGMCQGGRVQHHLKHNLWRPECAVIFVGYQAVGTLGRLIVDGAQKVHIMGETIACRARLYTINGFSAHADRLALLSWLGKTGKARLLINHGEEKTASQMVAELHALGRSAEVANPGVHYLV